MLPRLSVNTHVCYFSLQMSDDPEFLLVFHKSCVIRVHQLIAYAKSQEVCVPLYHRMRQMDKDGKKMVAEFVYWHAV